jgi:hypothetical protein
MGIITSEIVGKDRVRLRCRRGPGDCHENHFCVFSCHISSEIINWPVSFIDLRDTIFLPILTITYEASNDYLDEGWEICPKVM